MLELKKEVELWGMRWWKEMKVLLSLLTKPEFE